jgi:hypothetical protein
MHVGEFAFYIRRRISGDHPYVIKGALTQAENRGIRIQDTFLPPFFSVSVNPVKIILVIPVACFSVRFSLAASAAIRSDLFLIVVSF